MTVTPPVGGIKAHMHFILSVSHTALQGDIPVLVRRYLRISPPVAYHAPINSANGLTPFSSQETKTKITPTTKHTNVYLSITCLFLEKPNKFDPFGQKESAHLIYHTIAPLKVLVMGVNFILPF